MNIAKFTLADKKDYAALDNQFKRDVSGSINTSVLFNTKCGPELIIYNFNGEVIATARVRKKDA